MDAATITVERATGNVGAWVSGVDVRTNQPASVVDELTRALHEHGVLFFPSDEPVSDEEHQQFARSFGELESDYDADSDFFTVDSVLTPIEKYPTDVWHTDGTTRPCPPQAAALRCVVAPSVGGDTMWASMYAAYESLSSHFQRLLEGLTAVHNSANVAGRFAAGQGTFNESTQPVIVRDDVTGHRALYVNELYTQRIEGLSAVESERLLSMLFKHVNTPEFHVRLRWQPNTIAVWEERVTQHRAINDYTEHRTMRRLQIRGGRPTAA